MNTAICCIGKQENLYIRDYIEYYKKLGITHIYIYDNNDINGEHFEEVIQDFINNNYVTLINVRGKKCIQMQSYHKCYNSFGKLYDWMLFIDCGDEYLVLPNHNNISEFLSEPYFNDFELIHINLMTFGDCDKLYYENIPLIERFPEPIKPLDFHAGYNFPENDHVSSIIRGNLTNVCWKGTPHTPHPCKLKVCDAKGNKLEDPQSPFIHPFNFDNAYFKHFTTKTIEEYVNKVKRGYPDHSDNISKTILTKNRFFKFNTYTEEKSKLYDKLINS